MNTELASLATSPAAGVLAVVLGLLWGSFANVCIYRWPPSDEHPKGRSVVAPGSHCGACGTPIRWYDNVPILSYVWLRGRCRSCRASFSPRYLLVEALTGALFGVAWWFTLGGGGALSGSIDLRAVRFVIDAAFILCMVVITFIDIDTMLILDKITLPAIPVFYACSLLLPERHWWDGLVGAAVGYGLPWLIGELYFRLRKIEGMGLGDAKLLALVGALMGWRGVIGALFGGSIAGTIITIPLIVISRARRQPTEGEAPLMKTELPFGPWLAIGAVFYLFAEPWLLLTFRI